MTPIKLTKLVDAQKMHKLHPDTFDAPSAHELACIKPGDYVKICRENERFWCRVVAGVGKSLFAEVDGMLVNEGNANINLGLVVKFEYRHVYTIMSPPAG